MSGTHSGTLPGRGELGQQSRDARLRPSLARYSSEVTLPSSAEEAAQGVGGLLGGLFWEEVPGAQGVSSSVVAPGPPQRDRPTLPGVPGIERPLGAPQGQEGAGYPTPALTIRPVVLAIDGRGGPVLLADGVRVAGILEGLHVGGADLRGERGRGRAPSAERVVDDGIGDRRKDPLGE